MEEKVGHIIALEEAGEKERMREKEILIPPEHKPPQSRTGPLSVLTTGRKGTGQGLCSSTHSAPIADTRGRRPLRDHQADAREAIAALIGSTPVKPQYIRSTMHATFSFQKEELHRLLKA